MSDLIERLRKTSDDPLVTEHCSERLLIEAADEIERLQKENWRMLDRINYQDAENERLRAALERIANPRDGEGYGEDLREMAREAVTRD
jgi:DNA polymerase IIIc chi subunit